jgi:CTP:molybdopterin cytidylyltransferase MocA
MGTPKALVDDWLARGIDVLGAAGCTPIVVVLGAAAAQARALLQGRAAIIATAHDWRAGLSASLRAGIAALPTTAPAVVVILVDLPDVGETVIRRVLQQGVIAAAHGDAGARVYFDRNAPALVECADLASGRDIDYQGKRSPAGVWRA